MLKKFLEPVGTRGGKFLREDGFFFVTLLILNAPIISLAEDFQMAFVKFYFGAFAIFLVAVSVNFLFQKLPCVKKFIQAVVIILFATHFAADIFLLYKFGVSLNMDTWQVLLGTNPLTAKTFLIEQVLNVKIIFGLLVGILFLTSIIFGLKKFFVTRTPERLKIFAVELLMIFFLPLIFLTQILIEQPSTFAKTIFFNTTIGLSVRELDELVETAPIGDESKIFAEMDRQFETEKILGDKSEIPFVVFVLGESTDRNHMQLYGYRLPTTPRLTARFERGEIFRFNDTIACANNTAPAMARIFTFAEKDEPMNDWYIHANIFDVIRRAGYRTVWLSNQSPIGLWGNFDKYFSARCDEKFFIEAEDELARQRQIDGVLLPVLDKFLAVSPAEKNFFVIHLYGTHGEYKERYPAEFEKFSAADEDKPEESWRRGTAEYDNAVLYNDFIVDEIIRRFEDKNAVLIYISDHGEEVYDGRDFAWHSLENEGNVHMIEIPALIWASQKFRERYPEKISAINSAVDRPYRTDFLPHALLDLMDIRTTSFDATKSVLNEKFEPRPRIYNGAPYVKK